MDKRLSIGGGDINFLAFVTDGLSESVLKKIPYKELGINATIQIGQSDAAYNYLKKNDSPDLLLVDLSEASLPISEIERISEVCEPRVQVITMGVNNDVSIFRQLLNLGVSDYLVKPLNVNLLVRRIKEVISADQSDKSSSGFAYSGHTIGFVGAAGGVGTSTFAVNCGLSLAEQHNKHVGVIDMDLVNATTAHMLDVPMTKGLVEILKDPQRVDSTVLDRMITEVGNRFDILSSEDDIMAPVHECDPGMKVLMGLMAQRYNYTVIDCSHGAPNVFYELIFKMADTVVIVCDLTFTSVRQTAQLVRYYKNFASLQQKIMVVANRANAYHAGEIPKEDYEEAINHPIAYVADFDAKTPLEVLNNAENLLVANGSLTNDIENFTSHILGKPMPRKKTSILKFLRQGLGRP